MRSFEHIAELIRSKRVNHPNRYSQLELSQLLGYKSGQFISNVERAMCSIPLKMLGKVSEVLDIRTSELKQVILRDQEATLEHYIKTSPSCRPSSSPWSRWKPLGRGESSVD